MAYPNKPSSAPAIPFNSVGKSKNLNKIISAIAIEKLLALKTDGTYDNNFSIGDNTLNSLVNEINIRQGSNIKEYDNTGANLLRTLTLGSATNLAQGFRFLNEPIKISNNATNPLTEIDVSAGVMSPDDGTEEVRLSTNLTQSTANDFENGGLLPNGTVLQTNTMYYVFAIYSTDSNLISFYADTSKTNPTLPTSPNVYDKKQYRGAFYVDGSGNIATGSYIYNKKTGISYFTYDSSIEDATFVNTSSGFSNYSITVPEILCGAKVRAQSTQNALNSQATINLFMKDKPNNLIVSSGSSYAGTPSSTGVIPIPTKDAQIAQSHGGLNSRTLRQFTLGWIDYET